MLRNLIIIKWTIALPIMIIVMGVMLGQLLPIVIGLFVLALGILNQVR